MVKETQTCSPIKSISPRISVMRGMQGKKITKGLFVRVSGPYTEAPWGGIGTDRLAGA